MDERLWYTADWDLWLHLASRGTMGFLKRPLSAYRVHLESQTSRRSGELEELRRQQEAVLERHVPEWSRRASGLEKASVIAAARFSIELNSALAAFSAGRRVPLWRLVQSFVGLGGSGWQCYLRDSRIGDRVAARVRAGLWNLRAG